LPESASSRIAAAASSSPQPDDDSIIPGAFRAGMTPVSSLPAYGTNHPCRC
jgi:hypothetical protein